jgi:hypothetical protein
MTPKPKPAVSKAHDGAIPALSLPQLCSEAADHVARARIALGDDTLDADQALLHLDDAIDCLKRLLAHSRRGTTSNGSVSLRSA